MRLDPKGGSTAIQEAHRARDGGYVASLRQCSGVCSETAVRSETQRFGKANIKNRVAFYLKKPFNDYQASILPCRL